MRGAHGGVRKYLYTAGAGDAVSRELASTLNSGRDPRESNT